MLASLSCLLLANLLDVAPAAAPEIAADAPRVWLKLWSYEVRDYDLWIVATAICCSVACGILGCFLVLRRMALLGDAISHAILPGLAIAFIVTNSRAPIAMLAGAMVVGVLTAILSTGLNRWGRVPEDAAMGVVFTTLFAVGVVLITIVARDVDLDPSCVLYGLIEYSPNDQVQVAGLLLPRSFVWLSVVLALNATLIAIFFKELKIVCFDPYLATTMGISAVAVHYGLMTAVAVTSVASFESVGSILVVAMLVAPGATAHLLTDRLSRMLWIAALVGAISAILGYTFAIWLNTTVAGMIATVSLAIFVATVFLAPRHGVLAKRLVRILLLVVGALLSSPAESRADGAAMVEGEGEIEELRRRIGALEDLLRARPAAVDGAEKNAAEGALTPPWSRDALETPPPLRGIYDKPFLANLWGRAHLGGYSELVFHSFKHGTLGIPEGFRMQRTNLFLFTELSESVRFGSEIEFETVFEGRDPERDIEVSVEMAFADWTIYDQFSLRGGALLVPLGRVNQNHDGPVRELTDRPLVSRFVIPTTLTEAGVGAHGAFSLGGDSSLAYETYLVNGFNLLAADGTLAVPITERALLLREGRTSLGGDNNDRVASTGRVSLALARHAELGGSWHVGEYDERADNRLRVVAADLALSAGPFSIEGEIAQAKFARDAFARTSGVPDDFWGFYAQGSASGMPPFLASLLPRVLGREGASVSAVLRYDWVDLDGDRVEALEPGVNFRPGPDTVFKLSYRFGFKEAGPRSGPGTEGFHDDGFIFSVSTYF